MGSLDPCISNGPFPPQAVSIQRVCDLQVTGTNKHCAQSIFHTWDSNTLPKNHFPNDKLYLIFCMTIIFHVTSTLYTNQFPCDCIANTVYRNHFLRDWNWYIVYKSFQQ